MSDLISRQEVKEILRAEWVKLFPMELDPYLSLALEKIENISSAEPKIIRCKDCTYYDPPHVENNGERIEYSEMPKDAFDVLGVGLVSAEYGINIGGRCLRDYNVGYSEDKRVFVPETNYCGRAERKNDG